MGSPYNWPLIDQPLELSSPVSQSSGFLKDFIYLFLKRGERREKEKERKINVREKHQSVVSLDSLSREQTHNLGMCLTGNRTGDHLLCGMMPNQLSLTSQVISPVLLSTHLTVRGQDFFPKFSSFLEIQLYITLCRFKV